MKQPEWTKDIADKVTPSPEVRTHFRTAGEELLKGFHKLIDEKIETPLRERHDNKTAKSST